MNRQFLVSGIVVSIVALLFGGIVHAWLLAGDYAALGDLMRPQEEQMKYFQYNILAHVVLGFALTWIYRQGMQVAKPAIAQGARFGFAVACVMVIPIYLIYFAVQPLPAMLVAKQIVFDTIATTLLGVIVALLNRPAGTA